MASFKIYGDSEVSIEVSLSLFFYFDFDLLYCTIILSSYKESYIYPYYPVLNALTVTYFVILSYFGKLSVTQKFECTLDSR